MPITVGHDSAKTRKTLTVGDQERYYFLRILDPDTGRPVAFSSPVWVLPGASPLPLCEADGGGAGSIL